MQIRKYDWRPANRDRPKNLGRVLAALDALSAKKSKTKVGDWKEQVEFFSASSTLLFKSSVALGGLILAWYAAKERFFYDVSSLSALSALVFVTLSFAVSIAFLSVAGAFLLLGPFSFLVWLHKTYFRIRKRPQRIRLTTWIAHWSLRSMSCFLLLLFGSTVLVTRLSRGTINWVPIGYSLYAGLLILIAVGTESVSREIKSRPGFNPLWLGLAAPLIALLTLGPAASYVLDQSMDLLSFRSERNVYVTVNEHAYSEVRSLAEIGNIPVQSRSLGGDRWCLANALVVWRGFGATSYLRLLKGQDASMLVPLPATDVETVTVSPGMPGCSPQAAN